MKKITALILLFALIFSMVSCQLVERSADFSEAIAAVETLLGSAPLTGDVVLPTCVGDVQISYKSSAPNVFSDDGHVTRGTSDVSLLVTVTFTVGDESKTILVPVKVLKAEGVQSPDQPDQPDQPDDSTAPYGTADKPKTVDQAIAIMRDWTEGQIGESIGYVTGVVKEISGPNSYNSYFITLESSSGDVFKLYSISLGSCKAPEVGDTVVAEGYYQKYVKNGEITYEIPYLYADHSPSGSAYTPVLLSVTKGSQQGGNGSQPSATVHQGTANDPFTVADAILYAAEKVAATDTTDDTRVFLTGLVKSVEVSGNSYNVWLTDNAGHEFLCYIHSSAIGNTEAGDTITVSGYMKNYKGTVEIASNGQEYLQIVSIVKGSGGGSGNDPSGSDTSLLPLKTALEALDRGNYTYILEYTEDAEGETDDYVSTLCYLSDDGILFWEASDGYHYYLFFDENDIACLLYENDDMDGYTLIDESNSFFYDMLYTYGEYTDVLFEGLDPSAFETTDGKIFTAKQSALSEIGKYIIGDYGEEDVIVSVQITLKNGAVEEIYVETLWKAEIATIYEITLGSIGTTVVTLPEDYEEGGNTLADIPNLNNTEVTLAGNVTGRVGNTVFVTDDYGFGVLFFGSNSPIDYASWEIGDYVVFTGTVTHTKGFGKSRTSPPQK